MVVAARMLVWECHYLLLWHWTEAVLLVRKVALRDKRCSGRVADVVVAARCDMMVAVLLVPTVKTWARCLECQDDPSCRILCFIGFVAKLP